MNRMIGILLLVIGIVMLIWTGFTFTKREKIGLKTSIGNIAWLDDAVTTFARNATFREKRSSTLIRKIWISSLRITCCPAIGPE